MLRELGFSRVHRFMISRLVSFDKNGAGDPGKLTLDGTYSLHCSAFLGITF